MESRSFDLEMGRLSPYDAYNECFPLEKFEQKTLYTCGLIANSVFSDKIIGSLITKDDLKEINFVPGNKFTGYPKDLPMWKKSGISWKSDLKSYKNINDFDSVQFNKTYSRTVSFVSFNEFCFFSFRSHFIMLYFFLKGA